MSADRKLPLAGIVVADLTHHAAGPMCTMLLGDYGAEIIKIEPPNGDSFRTSGTIRLKDEHVGFLALNRNKRSVVFDLKTEAGLRAAEEIIRTADVVVENFRPGTMERLGLGYERLVELNPAIIYCSISAFGSEGIYKEKQGLDIVLQAMSGLMSITGNPSGEPVPCGAPVADIMSGVFAALAVVLAVLRRGQSEHPIPQRVELSMLNVMISLLGVRFQQVLATGQDIARLGSGHPQAAPWDLFQGADGAFVIAATTQEYWRRLCQGLGIGALADDARFARLCDRVSNRNELNEELNSLFKTAPRTHWLALLDAAQVPNGPVNSLSDLINGPDHRSAFMRIEHATAGSFMTAAPPICFAGESPNRQAPPLLGEHTQNVLSGHARED
jgi:crotonobetainyl-CoA:carnitine CoA-transferase CaiB-like acyl-CoA transferase